MQHAAEIIQRIARLACRDPGQRGLATFAGEVPLLAAATDLYAAERVILCTGFCIRTAMVGETDGPSGTLALADALRQLGKEIRLVTDQYSSPLLRAGQTLFAEPLPILVLNLPQSETDRQIEALLAAFQPTHVVAIERPGSAADGHRYSMYGEVLDDLIPGADRLLTPVSPQDYRSIAIGDGGNELGMGRLRDALKHRVKLGEKIFCTTCADHLIPAGISNWGAFALVAALSVLAGKRLLRPPAHELSVLQAMVAVGAVDGCTGKCAVSVDGLGWTDYAQTLADIYAELTSVVG